MIDIHKWNVQEFSQSQSLSYFVDPCIGKIIQFINFINSQKI